MTEVHQLIDSLENDLDRMRNLDPALKASMLARLAALRRMVSHG